MAVIVFAAIAHAQMAARSRELDVAEGFLVQGTPQGYADALTAARAFLARPRVTRADSARALEILAVAHFKGDGPAVRTERTMAVLRALVRLQPLAVFPEAIASSVVDSLLNEARKTTLYVRAFPAPAYDLVAADG